ncbi:heme-binding protein [Mesorhizobium sp. M1409]|uniref:GlcG/HbpS family heme-binding protein n=1 Tax=unclassified Mesorhizobium TaxID=325217 RepID=UPI00333AFCF4
MPKFKQISPVILSLDVARSITERAIEKIADVGVPYTITVLDGAGNLVLATRMDGAALASIDTSASKALTAVFFGVSTKDLCLAVSSGHPLATIETSIPRKLAFVAGGVPIRDPKRVVIGAVGAGGASPNEDHLVAEYAVASYSVG